MGTLDVFSDPKIDTRVKTSSVRPGGAEAMSDEMTIRDAVSSADLAQAAGDPVPWANSTSGSAGVIGGIVESRDDAGRTCRDFVTTRHSYEGVANFRGQACLTAAGAWELLVFERKG